MLYLATPVSNVDGVLCEGLKPQGETRFISLFPTPEAAIEAATGRGARNVRVLHIDYLNVEESRLGASPSFLSARLVWRSHIPRAALNIICGARDSKQQAAKARDWFNRNEKQFRSHWKTSLLWGEARYDGSIPAKAVKEAKVATIDPFPFSRLFIGTTTTHAANLLREGIKPLEKPTKGAGNWLECVDITSRLRTAAVEARWQANHDADGGQPVILQIDTAFLETAKCFPDHEFIARNVSLKGDPPLDVALSLTQNEPLEKWKAFWTLALDASGRIGYRGAIGPDYLSIAPESVDDVLGQAEAPTTESTAPQIPSLWEWARARFTLVGNSPHGLDHWQGVWNYASQLCAQVEGADPVVCEAFAVLHDAARQSDGRDPQHGERAASWLDENRTVLVADLTGSQFDLLREAIATHADWTTHENPTIAVCFDADRLCLPRVGIDVDPSLLSTDAARLIAENQ